MLTAFLWILAGLVLLVAGGEFTVRGGTSLANRFRIQPYIIGATVIAFGTSAPELAVTVTAALKGASGIALGNVVGSNIANLGLILGTAALLRPVMLKRRILVYELPIVAGVLGLLLLFAWNGHVGRTEGIVLLVAGVLALTHTLRGSARGNLPASELEPPRYRLLFAIPIVIAGLVALYFGGQFLVDGAVQIAEAFGVSQWVIGVVIVSLGTSMPEVAASVVAAYHGRGVLAIGNVLGSNTFNVLFVLGTGTTLHPVTADVSIHADLLVYAALTLFAVGWLGARGRLARTAGILLLGGYIAYIASRALVAG